MNADVLFCSLSLLRIAELARSAQHARQVRVFEPCLQYMELSLTQQFAESVNFKRESM